MKNKGGLMFKPLSDEAILEAQGITKTCDDNSRAVARAAEAERDRQWIEWIDENMWTRRSMGKFESFLYWRLKMAGDAEGLLKKEDICGLIRGKKYLKEGVCEDNTCSACEMLTEVIAKAQQALTRQEIQEAVKAERERILDRITTLSNTNWTLEDQRKQILNELKGED